MNLHKLQSKTNSNWAIAAASVIGNSHIREKVPCQDFCYYKKINPDYGIAIVSDGAGSCKNSHFGSRHIAHLAVDFFENILNEKKWIENKTFPDLEEWHCTAKKVLKEIKENLEIYAKFKNFDFKSLSCTIIAVIYSPNGILVTHIGDGRAGYLNNKGSWNSMITPYHGEEANQTVFITSDIWNENDIDKFIESNVIIDEISAFCILSDGCEKASFECNLLDDENGIYFDPNKPFPGFFNPTTQKVLNLYKSGLNEIKISELWEDFLYNGNEKFIKETDDKTMIIGVKIP
jgi:hypothetical protein